VELTQGSRLANFAMERPLASAHATTAALTKIGQIKSPYGTVEAWQRDAFGYYEIIGEVGYIIGVTANTVAACSIRPIEVDNEVAPGGYKETGDERVLRVWEAFQGPRGGKAELYRKAANHLQIAGESFLLGSDLIDEFGRKAGIAWEFVSPEELKVEGGGRSVKRNYGGYGGQQMEDLDPKGHYIARLWRSDPRFSNRPDCALKHVLPICREVVVLTQLVDAIAKSRLSAGILFVPDEMSFGPYDETEDDGDDTDDIDPFTEELITHLTAPVEDRTSASSLVPLVLRGAADFADKVKLIDVARDLNNLYMDLRQEAIGRLATGMDIPPEIMTGKGGLNHWTGYNIDADFISKHVAPLGDMLAEFLTAAYLRPMLVEFEDMTEEEASKYRLDFDASAITSRTDTGPNARAAYDRNEISRMAYLRENGFDESDAPTPEERQERDLRALMQAEPIIYGPQIMGMLYPDLEGVIDICDVECLPAVEEDGLLPEGGQDQENPSNLPARKRNTGPSRRPIIDDESGQDEPTPRGPAGPREDESIIDRLATGADAALERALEVAGSRILSKMNGAHISMKDRFRSTPKSQIISALTTQEFTQLGLTESDLFSGAWENIGVRGKGWLRKHFIERGVDNFTADEKSAMVVNALIPMLEIHATSAMGTPIRVGPNGLRVPNELIEKAFEQHERIPE
jgi:hypothetical protein